MNFKNIKTQFYNVLNTKLQMPLVIMFGSEMSGSGGWKNDGEWLLVIMDGGSGQLWTCGQQQWGVELCGGQLC